MHDPTVNRMTNGKGKVAEMTFDQIRALDLGARFPGQFPGLKVPTFDEALELAKKGGIGIYVDTQQAAPRDLVAAIERHEMGDHVMFWSEHPDFLKEIAALRPQWTLMPEAFNPVTFGRCWSSCTPRCSASISGISALKPSRRPEKPKSGFSWTDKRRRSGRMPSIKEPRVSKPTTQRSSLPSCARKIFTNNVDLKLAAQLS